ncbi:MAG: hypothetical protein AB2653_12165 [Candidatus Thiodiazotropha endolucinida]
MQTNEVITQLAGMGITLEIDGDSIWAYPKSALSDDARQLIRLHKPALLDALRNGQNARILAKRTNCCNGRAATATPATVATPIAKNTPTVANVATVAVMACTDSPLEQSEDVKEAIEERRAILDYESGLDGPSDEAVADLAVRFYSHLFGEAKRTNCCNGRSGRFCSEGQRLKVAYYAAERHKIH